MERVGDSMTICKACGWELVLGFWSWKDKMGHEFCVDNEPHQPMERVKVK
jgi:hypothetical protein